MNVADSLWPQDLCICCLFCLEHSSHRCQYGLSLASSTSSHPFPVSLSQGWGFLILKPSPQSQIFFTSFLFMHSLYIDWPSSNILFTYRCCLLSPLNRLECELHEELYVCFHGCILSAWSRVGSSWQKALVVGRTRAPRVVQVLISETDYVTLPGLLLLGLCWCD